jgi:hypothetical protein
LRILVLSVRVSVRTLSVVVRNWGEQDKKI